MNRSPSTHALLATALAAFAACASAQAASTAATTAPAQAVPVAPMHMAGATVLLVEDDLPWGYDSNERVLASLGVAYDLVHSRDLGSIVLDPYTTVIIPSVQSDHFYARIGRHVDALDAWLRHGARTLEFHTALNVSTFQWALPGGLTVARRLHFTNSLSGVESSLLTGLPEKMHGDYASHMVFHGRPKHQDRVLITTGAGDKAVMVDYCLGPGRVIATGQTVEYAWANGWDFAPVLLNMLSASTLTPGCPG